MKKIIIVLSIVMPIILAIMILVAYIILDNPSGDIPSFDEADLKLQRIMINEEENTFFYLEKASKLIYYPDDADEEIKGHLANKHWDENLVKELVERNMEVFNLIDKGSEMNKFQVPEIDSFGTELRYLAPCRRLARLRSIYAASLFKQGREKEAFEEAIKIVQFGYKIQNAGGGLIHYLVGIASKEIGFRRLKMMIPLTNLDNKSLQSYIQDLKNYTANEEGLANTIKCEYFVESNTIEALSKGQIGFSDFLNLLSEEEDVGKNNLWSFFSNRLVRINYFLRPNKTKKMLADTHRKFIENIPRHYSEVEVFQYDFTSFFDGLKSEEEQKFGYLENGVGKILYQMLTPANKSCLLEKVKENVELSATRLLMALKCYKNDHGDLPESLNQLIKTYIGEIPIDDYDGNPLRYSKEKRIIYSVGEDLKDTGGSRDGNTWEQDDPSYEISF